MALNAFANVFRIAELRSRLIYTLVLLAVSLGTLLLLRDRWLGRGAAA